ncbi:hypothetical protein OEZ85_011013 [Tetradesmus obliquus]|uniref:Nudix hydrolase domain-containing protein n=1 Tax=Tetradesmus obliquus TaxID=3088 RepID=A0ABY8TR59_TETOB|nr:hypothetical protein OEZ85_011013 [Tetradesmus obliquus]
MAYAAGILPYTFHSGSVYLMLGKDVRDGSWSDFGGKSESVDAKPLDTACREFYEETCGIVIDPKSLHVRMAGQVPFSRTYTQHGKVYYMYSLQMPFRADHSSNFRRMLAYMKHINCFKRKVEKTDIRWVPVEAMLSGSIRLRSVFENTFCKCMLDGRGISFDANSDGERTIQLVPEASMGADHIQLVAPGQHYGRQPAAAAAATSTAVHQSFTDTSFQDFMNPDKVAPAPLASDHVAFEQDNISYMPQQPCDAAAIDCEQQQPGPQPGGEYVSVEDELADLTFKLDRLHKKGIPVRRFAGCSIADLRDMRAEFNRIKTEIEFDNSLKFGKKALCGVVSVIEWLNQKYQPFDLQLEGWSESIMTNIDSYENSLERLIVKYRHRINAPPEIELALSLAASGLMYHMTNTMFKQAMLSGGGANPDFIKSMVGALSGASNAAAPPPPPPPPQQQQQQQRAMPTPQSAKPAYQMKGPGISLGPLMQAMPTPMAYPQPANPPPPTRCHPQVPTPVDSTPPTASPTTVTLLTDDGDGGGDRFSDINSEDMQSIRSVDLESVAGSLTAGGDDDIKTFSIPAIVGAAPSSSTAARLRSKRAARNTSSKPRARRGGGADLRTLDI